MSYPKSHDSSVHLRENFLIIGDLKAEKISGQLPLLYFTPKVLMKKWSGRDEE